MTIPVDQRRLWQSIMDMAEIGALPNGGSCRTALSPEDKAGRDLFVAWCRDAGCTISCDAIGNIFARRAGRDNHRPAVATGSHLDTQPHGGKFDGIYGVLAGLEVVRALNDAKVTTEAPVEVVVWTNEEGVRFGPPLTGSSVFCGAVELEAAHASKTADGTTVQEDLASIGYLGDEAPGEHRFDCFIEAHIEQGPILEAENLDLGVVTQVQGIRWLTVSVEGQDGHAGTTPMNKRRDALRGAAKMICRLNEIAPSGGEATRLTVGKLDVTPNSGATIPGRVDFNVDLRHPDRETLQELDARFVAAIEEVAREDRLHVSVERPIDIAPVQFDHDVISAVRSAAASLNYSHIDMLSGAGHDAMNVAAVAPAAMIFVPCEKGISHNEAENARPEHLAAGAHALLHAMLARAGS